MRKIPFFVVRSLPFALGLWACMGDSPPLVRHDATDVIVLPDAAFDANPEAASDATVDGAPDAVSDATADAVSDARADGVADASADARIDSGPPVYNDWTHAGLWSAFQPDQGTLSFASALSVNGYVYFIPTSTHSKVWRYDTTKAFNAQGSWNSFDTSFLGGGTSGYSAGVSDGRYIYLVPGSGKGLAVRYDTTASFSSMNSWETYDLYVKNPRLQGFGSGIYANGYVYFVPNHNGIPSSADPGGVTGLSVRYNVVLPFNAATSWETFDVHSLDSEAYGFTGGVNVNGTVFFAPSLRYGGDGIDVVRFDTSGAFAGGGWGFTNVYTLSGNTIAGLTGAGFDGQYVYFGPMYLRYGAARYDTLRPVADPDAWQLFDMRNVPGIPTASGSAYMAFDGRYMYFPPAGRYFSDGGYNDQNSALIRFDTTGVFANQASWSFVDLVAKTGNANAKLFSGGCFDGQYFYLPPAAYGIVVRLDAKSPASIPAALPPGGSFQ